MKNTKLLTILLGTSLIFSACGANNQNAQPTQEVAQQEAIDTTVESADVENNDDDDKVEVTTTTEPKEEDTALNTMPQVALSLDDALKAYYDHFGDDTISIVEISLDLDDGVYQYEIDGYKDGTEYDADIDANTGEVVQTVTDDDDDEDDTPIDLAAIIKPEEAMEKALAGQEGAYVVEWSLDVDDGRTVYEIDIENGEDREVDANTGEVFDD